MVIHLAWDGWDGSRAGLSPTASPTWVIRGQTGVTSPQTGEQSSPNWSNVVGTELLGISGLSATQAGNSSSQAWELHRNTKAAEGGIAAPGISPEGGKSRTGTRVGRSSRGIGGCSWPGSTEVMGTALNCSSPPPKPSRTSPVWVLCFFHFLKQDFGKTGDATV